MVTHFKTVWVCFCSSGISASLAFISGFSELNGSALAGRFQILHDSRDHVVRRRFQKILGDAELLHFFPITLFSGGSQDDSLQVLARRLSCSPRKDFEAVYVRQLEVEEHERRKGVGRTIHVL